MIRFPDIGLKIAIGIIIGTCISVFSNPFYGFVVGLIILVLIYYLTKPQIKITSPKNGEEIPCSTNCEGTYHNFNKNNLYLIHSPLRKPTDKKDLSLQYYNNKKPDVKINKNYILGNFLNWGTWECHANIGYDNVADIDREFEIDAIISADSFEREKELPAIPTNEARYTIKVIRK